MRASVFVAALSFLAWTLPASAQAPQILVAKPPAYQPGEQYIGELDIPDLKARLELRQFAFRGTDGVLYVESDTVTWDGVTIEKVIVNPSTALGTITTPLRTTRILSTTCTPDKIYPVFVGKKLSCSLRESVNGVEKTVVDEYDFMYVVPNKHGDIISICGSFGHEGTTAYECSTSDMKWIRFVMPTNN